MSNVSNVHDVVSFDAKNSKAFSGQRLSKVLFKAGKNVTEKKQSVCVSIPVFAINSDQMAESALLPHINSMLQAAQDGIVRDAVEAGKLSVSDADISFAACISYLDEAERGERMSKEAVTTWFDEVLADAISVAIADKMGFSDTPTEKQTAGLAASVAAYKEKFSSLAGGRTSYAPDTAAKLAKTLELAQDAGEIGSKLKARLVKMQEVKPVELFDL